MTLFNYLSQINSSPDLFPTLIRTIIVYIYAVFLIRITNNRLQLKTVFDFVLIVVVGAVLGRTIYGEAPLVTTLAAALMLVLVHKTFAILSFKYHRLGKILKGRTKILYSNGTFNKKIMKKTQITQQDIIEACRFQLHFNSLEKIAEIRLERNGTVSFITK